MSNAVRNAPCNAVTYGVRNVRCGWVQNQNQNQTVLKAVGGSSVANVHSIHQAVDASDLARRTGWGMDAAARTIGGGL